MVYGQEPTKLRAGLEAVFRSLLSIGMRCMPIDKIVTPYFDTNYRNLRKMFSSCKEQEIAPQSIFDISNR